MRLVDGRQRRFVFVLYGRRFSLTPKKIGVGFSLTKKKSGFFSVLVVFKISVFLEGFRTFVDVFARFCMFSDVFERVTDLDTVLPSLLN